MKLTPKEAEALDKALWNAFPDPSELSFPVQHLNHNLHQLNVNRPHGCGLYEWIVRTFQSEGKLPKFLDLARERNRDNLERV